MAPSNTASSPSSAKATLDGHGMVRARNSRISTIGVGTVGTAPYPVQTPFGIELRDMEVKIDEDLLTQIAATTGGQYFRATSNKKLEEIYKEIDKLEKSKIDVQQYSRKSEEFLPFALLGALFLIAALLLRTTIFRSIP